MEDLILNGTVTIDGMTFQDIQGGFGPRKKALLAKDIAAIHGREVREINENVNKNRTKFIDGVDIIDLKGSEFAIVLADSEIMSKNAINASRNIYLFSERGYAKLLKILEDDKAWEQYDKLVDGYFEMKRELNDDLSGLSPQAALNIQMAKVIAQNELRLVKVEQQLKVAIDKQDAAIQNHDKLIKQTAEKIPGIYKRLDGVSYAAKELNEQLEDREIYLDCKYKDIDEKVNKMTTLFAYKGESWRSTLMRLVSEFAPGRIQIVFKKAGYELKREYGISLEIRLRHCREKMAVHGCSLEEINSVSLLDVLENKKYKRERGLFLEAVKKVLAAELNTAS